MSPGTRSVYRFGPYRLDVSDRLLFKDNQTVVLPPKVIDTLLLLAANRGHVVGKDELMKQLWPDTFVEEGALSQYVSLLRKALGENGRWVETIPRRGYRFTAPVEELAQDVVELQIEEHTRSRTVIEEETVTEGRISLLRVVAAAAVLIGVGAAALLWIKRTEPPVRTFRSVAVLPFRTVSDTGQGYLADGITEALITRLTNLEGLRVVSYSRMQRFKGSTEEAAAIGRQLRVEAVIEGTVRVASGRLRLSVHAVETKTAFTLWADDRFEVPLAGLLNVESRLAETVAVRLRGQLTPVERSLVTKPEARNASAYDLVLRARGLLRDLKTARNRMAALNLLSQAVQLDTGFADAHGWLAFAQYWVYQDGVAGAELVRAAITHATQALSIDPNLGIALRALTHIQTITGRELEGLMAAKRYLDINPDDLDAMAAAAEAYFRTGLYDRSMPLYQKALTIEPDNHEFRRKLARIYLLLGEYSKGVDAISHVPPIEVGPFGMLVYAEAGQMDKAIHAVQAAKAPGYFAGCVLAASGDRKSAIAVWRERVQQREVSLQRNENPLSHYSLGLLHAGLGNKEQAENHAKGLLAPDPRHPVHLFYAAEIRSLAGDRQSALATLKAAVENGFFNLPMVDGMTRPLCGTLYSLRGHPEFRAIRSQLARRVDDLRERY